MLVATLSCESRQTLEAIDLSHINEIHRGKFKEFLFSHADIFASKSKKLGATPLVKHRIETSSDVPVARATYKKRDCEPIVWNREIIRRAQRKYQSLAEIISEVSQGNNGDYFLDDDGILYKKTTETRHADCLVIPEGLKVEFIQMCHDSPFAGHCRIDKTYERMRARFYWLNMYRDVRNYVNACVPCAQRKTTPHRKPAPLVKMHRVERSFQRIAMDVVGPLVTTDTGNNAIGTTGSPMPCPPIAPCPIRLSAKVRSFSCSDEMSSYHMTSFSSTTGAVRQRRELYCRVHATHENCAPKGQGTFHEGY
ncbi:hypothetical protein CBL_10646 [Carabus blaptoides fortunei]